MSRRTAAAAAASMGTRAGERFRATGMPSRNPFIGKKRPPVGGASRREELAATWRRAYFAALGSGRSGPS